MKYNELGWHLMRHEYLDLKENLHFNQIGVVVVLLTRSTSFHRSLLISASEAESTAVVPPKGGKGETKVISQQKNCLCHPYTALTHMHTRTRSHTDQTSIGSDISELSWRSWRSLPVEGQMEERRMTCGGWTMDGRKEASSSDNGLWDAESHF